MTLRSFLIARGYVRKADCLHAIKLVKSSASAPEINLTPHES